MMAAAFREAAEAACAVPSNDDSRIKQRRAQTKLSREGALDMVPWTSVSWTAGRVETAAFAWETQSPLAFRPLPPTDGRLTALVLWTVELAGGITERNIHCSKCARCTAVDRAAQADRRSRPAPLRRPIQEPACACQIAGNRRQAAWARAGAGNLASIKDLMEQNSRLS